MRNSVKIKLIPGIDMNTPAQRSHHFSPHAPIMCPNRETFDAEYLDHITPRNKSIPHISLSHTRESSHRATLNRPTYLPRSQLILSVSYFRISFTAPKFPTMILSSCRIKSDTQRSILTIRCADVAASPQASNRVLVGIIQSWLQDSLEPIVLQFNRALRK